MLYDVDAHDQPIVDMLIHQDTIATLSKDKTVKLWDHETSLASILELPSQPTCFISDQNDLYISYDDQSVVKHDPMTVESLRFDLAGTIKSMTIDDDYLIVGSKGKVQWIDKFRTTEEQELVIHEEHSIMPPNIAPQQIRHLRDNVYIYSSMMTTWRIDFDIDPKTDRNQWVVSMNKNYQLDSGYMSSFDISPCLETILISIYSGSTYHISLDSTIENRFLKKQKCHEHRVNQVKWIDENTYGTVSTDHTFKVTDKRHYEIVQTYEHDEDDNCVKFLTMDNQYVVACNKFQYEYQHILSRALTIEHVVESASSIKVHDRRM